MNRRALHAHLGQPDPWTIPRREPVTSWSAAHDSA